MKQYSSQHVWLGKCVNYHACGEAIIVEVSLWVCRWHGVAIWKWDVNDDVCGICRLAFDACCPDCTVPGDNCSPGDNTVALDCMGDRNYGCRVVQEKCNMSSVELHVPEL